MYFYKIRKSGTETYYAGRRFDWCDVRCGYIWHEHKYVHKIFEKLRHSFECEIVKFEFKEVQ